MQRFASDGTWLAMYGGTAAGDAPGQFTEPLGVAVGPGGEVLVADTRNDRVQRRDPVTGAWSVLPGSFARPSAVAVGADGRRYVAEAGAGRVRVLRPDGIDRGDDRWAARARGRRRRRGRPRRSSPTRSATGCSATRRRRAAMRLESELGGRGSEPGRFVLPIGVAADGAGAIWVADTYNHRMQRFAPPAPGGAAAPPAGRRRRAAAAARARPVTTAPPSGSPQRCG